MPIQSTKPLRRYPNMAEGPVSETGEVRVQIPGGVPKMNLCMKT